MASARHQSRGWAHLPPELLEMIARRVALLPDLVRFGSVCAPWRSAFRSAAPSVPPQLPWLLFPEEEATAPITPQRRFFSVAENRTYTLPPLPDPPRAPPDDTFPSSCGRVITRRANRTLALHNPPARSPIPLPPLPPDLPGEALRAKVFGADLVGLLIPTYGYLLFCRPGEASWKRIDTQFGFQSGDFAYSHGHFVVINSDEGTVWVFAASTLKKIQEIPLFLTGRSSNYLVELPSGELVLVRRTGVHGRIALFVLERSEGVWVCTEVGDIGKNVIFIDGLQAMAFPATDIDGCNCKGNHVYFLDYFRDKKDMGMKEFDVREGQIVDLIFYRSSEHPGRYMWVVPTLPPYDEFP